MLFVEAANASQDVAAMSRRTEKIERLARVLGMADLDVLSIVVSHPSGALPQGRIGAGFSMLRDLGQRAAAAPTLDVIDVDATLSEVKATTGSGSKAAKRDLPAAMLALATEPEQTLLLGLLAGEIRQGALDGVMSEAIAHALAATPAVVRRAAMLSGELSGVAVTAATSGDSGLSAYRLRLFQPLQPMLATTAESAEAAVASIGDAFVDWKVDGARVQIHYDGKSVRAYTRNLKDVTFRLPGMVQAVAALGVGSAVFDAEVVALRPGGRPRPFQETMSRFGRTEAAADVREALPLTTFVFDVLHLDGVDLIDRPLRERVALTDAVVPDEMAVPRLRTAEPGDAQDFYEAALASGYEGVMVKAADSVYAAGRRGSEWLKVKPAHTLDLVIIAVEWGSGRRRGWLSNLHLGAYDPVGDRYVMLGNFQGADRQAARLAHQAPARARRTP